METGIVQFGITFFAKPHQSIIFIFAPLQFNDQANSAFRTHRTMRCISREQKQLSLFDWDIYRFSVFLDPDIDIPLNLVIQLFCLIKVIVLSGIRSGYDHDYIIAGVVIKIAVSYWWLELMTVLVYPGLKIEGSAYHGLKLIHFGLACGSGPIIGYREASVVRRQQAKVDMTIILNFRRK